MNIIDVKWFSHLTSNESSTIGIVLIQTTIGTYKAYIGTGRGYDEEHDKQIIASAGGKFHWWWARYIWPHILEEDWDKT